jgi:MFS family permease
MPRSSDKAPASLWRPLRSPTFRNLLIADVVSDIGTFMQSVGAAWLMVSLGAGPLYVALTQTASTLPFFVLALPAGSIGDIVDRRTLILYTEAWMVGIAIVLAGLTTSGHMSPWLLLGLTFALSAGDAIESPTWRAILPELVGKEDLAPASALNGIEFNFARAVGPALAGVLIATAGIGAAFVVNVVSFIGVIWVIARWKPSARKRTTPPETVAGATRAAIRYVRFSPVLRALMFRTGVVMFFGSGLLALLPTVAERMSNSAVGYGLLLGCFGTGAVIGALVMQRARARWSNEAVASCGIAVFGAATVVTGAVHVLGALAVIMLVAGAAWIVFISLMSALVQSLTPDWARARVLAVNLLVFQGGMAAGSVAWGALATRESIQIALIWAGIGTLATTALGLVAPLPDTTADISPWNHWRMPVMIGAVAPALDEGPVLVAVEYQVDRHRVAAFVAAMLDYERVRRRDGASRWGLFRDVEHAERYVETFLVSSWAEHLRQHDRLTLADRELEERVRSYARDAPNVRHLIHVSSD